MAIHFKSVELDAQELIEQAEQAGLEFTDDAEKVRFLEMCELIYRMGAEFGFDAAMNAMVLKAPGDGSQMLN